MKFRTREQNYYQNNACKESFICKKCGRLVVADGAGSNHRNHCPFCLHSLHVDDLPGDRAANCGGMMEPIGIWVRKNGEWALIHKCDRCGHLSTNRIAADDNQIKLLSISMKALSHPAFPLENISPMCMEQTCNTQTTDVEE